MEIQHFSHKEHPLIFVEDLQNEVVCSGCEETVWGHVYKCSECNFFLHKSCAELPPEIQHPLHQNHTLVLQLPSRRKLCEACYKGCENSFFYHCNTCDFDGLHVECASGWRTKPDYCHQHEFVPIFQQIHFTCEACGEDCNSFAQVCRICQLLAHTECTKMPRTIRIIADRHLLTLIYSLGKVMKEHDDHVFCNLCYKKVKLKYGGYYCRECDFVAHLECARQNWIGPNSDTIDSSIHLIKDIDFEEDEEWEELKHCNHEHYLIISRNEIEVDNDHKLCEGCMQSITAPFYSCQQCNYFLHSKCARLPLKLRYPKHPHLLTLSTSTREKYIHGLTFCRACDRFSHGFAYNCHKCHNYSLDIRCCLIPKTFKHEGHQHSLFHAISSVEKCNACDRSDNNNGVFVCIKCNFALGFECATLPLKAKHEYDPHPLSLTYAIENDSGEYYCLICEEERNPNHWFYYCVKCNFATHLQCVVGKHPYIMYGRNFTQEHHQHPLNFVRRTKESRPCNVCSETFDEDAAVNCTQCKSIVHLWAKCFYQFLLSTE